VASIATRGGAFIGGRWVAGEGEEIEVTSPATGEVLGSVRASTPEQVDAAVRAAAEAFQTWRRTSVLERVEICRRAFTLCQERNEEIAQMIAREVGKTIREAREEMEEYTADHFRRASEDVLRHAGQVLPSTQERNGTKRIMVVHEPVGVVAAVTPWNFPVDIAGIPVVYGLAVGCTVVWKPSEHAPLCAEMFVELLNDAGFPFEQDWFSSHFEFRFPLVGQITQRGIHRSPPQDMYFKGALFLNTLRSVVNDDQRWWKLLHDFFQHFKYQNILTEDVIAYFNAQLGPQLGRDLTPIFNQYLRRTDLPVLELAFNQSEGTVAYRWKADERDFAMPIRVGTADSWQVIQPTTDWKVMKTSLNKDTFDVATDLFCVNVSKQ